MFVKRFGIKQLFSSLLMSVEVCVRKILIMKFFNTLSNLCVFRCLYTVHGYMGTGLNCSLENSIKALDGGNQNLFTLRGVNHYQQGEGLKVCPTEVEWYGRQRRGGRETRRRVNEISFDLPGVKRLLKI